VLQKENHKLSKRRRNLWDDEPYELDVAGKLHSELLSEEHEYDEDSAGSAEFLEDAHEALSKLFNKTNKRGKQMRGIRRKDAWQ
jgi:hypothetical protein